MTTSTLYTDHVTRASVISGPGGGRVIDLLGNEIVERVDLMSEAGTPTHYVISNYPARLIERVPQLADSEISLREARRSLIAAEGELQEHDTPTGLVADFDLADVLAVRVGSALLAIDRITRNRANDVVEVAQVVIAPGRHSLSYDTVIPAERQEDR